MAAAQYLGAGQWVTTQQCYFRPALFWQTLQPWHIADGGLEFRMNVTTGTMFANNVGIIRNLFDLLVKDLLFACLLIGH